MLSLLRCASYISSHIVGAFGSGITATTDVSGLSASGAAVVIGNFAYDHQRWSEAILQYEQAIAGGANTPDVRTDLGNALRFRASNKKR